MAVVTVLVVLIVYLLKKIFTPPKPIVLPPPRPQPVIEKRGWTRAELQAYSGTDPSKPILLGVKGQVYDVSSRRSLYGPGGPYALFAGKDASRGLAKGTLDAADAINYNVSDLTQNELSTLDEWASQYSHKYTNVGWIVDESKTSEEPSASNS